MGVFTQLGLLLRRYLIIRKRQPVILLLEVLWPLLIFVIVAVVRQGAPPVTSHDCRYAERAMPNAGLLPFLQSYACNLDNKCYKEDELEATKSHTERLSDLLDELAPHLSNLRVIQALDSLKNGSQLLEVIDNSLSNKTWLVDYIENGIPMRDLFRDVSVLRRIIVDEQTYMEGETFDVLMNGSISIDGLLSKMTNFDVKGIICNKTELQHFLSLQTGDAGEISQALCSINTSKINELIKVFQEHLDVVKIVKLLGKTITDYTLREGFYDVADLLDMILSNPLVKPLLDNMPALFKLKDVLYKFPDFIEGIKNFQSSGPAAIRELVLMLDPIISSLTKNNPIWTEIKNAILMVDDFLDMIFGTNNQGSELTLKSFFSNMEGVSMLLKTQGISENRTKELMDSKIRIKYLALYLRETDAKTLIHELVCSNDHDAVSTNSIVPSDSKIKTELKFVCRNPEDSVSEQFMSYVKLSQVKEQALAISMSNVAKPILTSLQHALGYLGKISEIPEDVLNILKTVSSIHLEATFDTITKMFSGLISPEEAVRTLSYYLGDLERTLAKLPTANQTRIIMAVLDTSLSTVTQAFDTFTGIENYLRTLLNDDLHAVGAIKDLLNLGPQAVKTLLKAFTDPNKLMTLVNDTENIGEIFCDSDRFSQFLGIPKSATLESISAVFCNNNVTVITQNIINQLHISEFEDIFRSGVKKIEGYMNVTDFESNMEPFNLSAILWKSKRLYDSAVTFYQSTTSDWRQLISKVSHIHLNGSNWDRVWMAVNTDAWTAGFGIVVETWGPILEQSELWPTVAPYLRMAKLYMEDTYRIVQKTEEFFGTNSSLGRLMTYYTQYGPEMLDGFVYMMTNPGMIDELISSPDIRSTLCNPVRVRGMLNLPDYVPIKDILETSCSIDYSQLWNQFTSMYTPSNIDQQVMDLMNNTNGVGEAQGFDWSNMVDEVLTIYNSQSRFTDMFTDIFTNMDYHHLEKSLDNFTHMMEHMSFDNYARLSGILLGFGAELDPQLTDNPVWRLAKHYINLFDLYIVDLNKNGFSLSLKDMYPNAPQLHEAVEKLGASVPDLIEALQNMIIHPYKLSTMLLDVNPKESVCGGLKISSLFDVSDPTRLRELEQSLCQLNWTAIAIEMGQDPRQVDINNAMMAYMMGDPVSDIALDWKKLITDVSEFFNNLQNPTMTDPLQQLEALGFNTTAINIGFKDLLNATETYYTDPLLGLKLSTDLFPLMDKISSKDESLASMWKLQKVYLYVINQLLDVANQNLPRLQGKKEVNILEFLNSEELDKIAEALKASPDIVQVLMNTLLDLMANSELAAKLSNPLELMHVCTDRATFESVFPEAARSQIDIQGTICNASLVNVTKLIDELQNSIYGLSHMIQSVSSVLNGNETYSNVPLNISSYLRNYEKFVGIITDLIKTPPMIDLGIGTRWMNATLWEDIISKYGGKFEQIMKRYESMTGDDVVDMITTSIKQQFVSLTAVPQFNGVLAIVGQIAKESNTVLEQLLAQNTSDIKTVLVDYPTISRLFDFSNKLPQILATIIYTNNYNPMALTTLFEQTTSWESFCTQNISLYIQNVPGLNFDMTSFTSELCDINITKLTEETETFLGVTDLKTLRPLDWAPSNDSALNIARMYTAVDDMAKVLKLSVQLFSAPPPSLREVFSWLNQSLWDTTFTTLGNRLADPATLLRMVQSLDGLTPLLDNLSRTDEFFGFMWKAQKLQIFILNEFLELANKNLPRLNGKVDLLDFFQSEELSKIASALQASPEMVKLLFDTFLDIMQDPTKSSKFSDPNKLMMVCDDSTQFSELFPASVTSKVDLQEVICNLTLINSTVLVEELETGVYGLSQLIHSLTVALQPGTPVESLNVPYLSMAKNYELFMGLITNLTKSPPEIVIGEGEEWTNPQTWDTLWTSFGNEFMNSSQQMQLMGVSELVKRLIPYLEMQMKPLYQVQGFNFTLAQIQKVVGPTLMTLEFIKANSSVDMYALVSEFPEVEKVFRIANNIPYLLISALQPNVLASIYKMVEKFMTVGKFTVFCAIDLTELFPGLPNSEGLSPEKIKQKMCEIDLSSLTEQFEELIKYPPFVYVDIPMEFVIGNTTITRLEGTMMTNVSITETLSDVVELCLKLPGAFQRPLTIPHSTLFDPAEWNKWWPQLAGRYDLKSAQSLLELTTSMRATLLDLLKGPAGKGISPSMLASLDGVIKYLTNFVRMIQVGKLPNLWAEYQKLTAIQTLGKLSEQAPEILDVFLETLMDPEKSKYLLGLIAKPNATLESFCNLTQFETNIIFMKPVNSSVNITEVQSLICSVDFSETLGQQLLNVSNKQLGLMPGMLNPSNSSSPIDFTNFVNNIVSLQEGLLNLTVSPPEASMFALNISDFVPFYNMFLPSTWQSLYDKLSAKLMANPASFLDLLQSMKPIFGELLKNPNSKDSTMVALMGIDETLLYMTDYFKKLQEGKMIDPFEMYKDASNFQSLLKLFDQAPELVEILIETVLNSTQTQAFTSLFTVEPEKAFDRFCNVSDLREYFDQPIGSPVDLAVVQRIICQLNPMELANELSNTSNSGFSFISTFFMSPRQFSSSQNQSFDVDLFFKHVTEFQSAFNNFTLHPLDLSLFSEYELSNRWFVSGSWDFMISRVVKRITDQSPASIAAISNQLLPLLNMIPSGQSVTKILQVVTVEIEVFLEKVDQLGNRTTFALADLFPESPNIRKLASFIDSNPEIVDILLYSVNTGKFASLYSMNVEQALTEICSSPTNYFTLPDQNAVLVSIVNEFCQVNLTALAGEFNSELRIQELTSSDKFDIGSYLKATERLTEVISRWIATPPPMITFSSQWSNETYWMETLQNYAESISKNPSEFAMQEVALMLSSLMPLFPKDDPSFQAVSVVMGEVTRIVKNKLNELASGTVSLNTLFSDAPRVKQLLTDSLEITPDLLESVFRASIYNIDKFYELVTSLDWHSLVCDRPGALQDYFNFPAEINSTEVQRIVCSINETVLSAEFMQLFGINNIVTKLEMLKNGTYTVDWQQLFRDSNELYTAIDNIIRNPPTIDFPKLDTNALDKIAQKFISGEGVAGLTNLIKVYNILDKYLKGTEEWEAASAYYKASQVFTEYINDLVGRIKVNNHKVDLSSLFGNSSRIRHILDMAFNLGPDFVTGFLSASIKPSMIQELVSGRPDIARLFCSETDLRKYFIFHPSFNLTYAVSALCNIDDQQFVQELKDTFNIAILEQKLLDINNASVKFDPVKYIQESEEFSMNLARLFNSSGVVYGDKDLVKYLFQVEGNVDDLVQNALAMAFSPNISDYAMYLDMLMPMIEKTEFWSSVRPVLVTYNIMADVINQKLTVIETEPITLENLLKNSTNFLESMKKIFNSGPELLEAMMKASISPDKLLALLPKFPDFPDTRNWTTEQWINYTFPTIPPYTPPCLLDYMNLQADFNTTFKDFLCDVNATIWLQELKKEINYDKIFAEFMKVGQNTSQGFDWKEFLMNIQVLQQKIGMLPKVHLKVKNFPQFLAEFFSYHGDIDDWLNRLQTAVFYSPQDQKFDELGMIKIYVSQVLSSLGLSSIGGAKESPDVSTTMTALGRMLSLLKNQLAAMTPDENPEIRTLLKRFVIDPYVLFGVTPDVADKFLSLKFKPGKLRELVQSGNKTEILCEDASSLSEILELPTLPDPALNDLLSTVFCNTSSEANRIAMKAISAYTDSISFALNQLLVNLDERDNTQYNGSTVSQQALSILDMLFVRPDSAHVHQLSPALDKLLNIWNRQYPMINAKLFAAGTNLFLGFFEKGSEIAVGWNKFGAAFDLVLKALNSVVHFYLGEPLKTQQLFSDYIGLAELLPKAYMMNGEFDMALRSGTLNLKQLHPLFSRTTGADELCEDEMFQKVFMFKGNFTVTKDELHRVLCQNKSELFTQLKLALDYDVSDIFSQMTSLLTSFNKTYSVDWTGLYMKTDSLVKLIVKLSSMSPRDVMERLVQHYVGTQDSLKTILDKLSMGNPKLISHLVQSVAQLLSPVDSNRYLYPIFQYLDGPVFQGFANQIKMYREIFSSNTTDVISSILDFDKVGKLQLETLGDIAEKWACDQTKVRDLLKRTGTPFNATAVSVALCGQPVTQWYQNLIDMGMGPFDIIAFSSMIEGSILVQSVSGPKKNPPLSSLNWSKFGKHLEALLTEVGIPVTAKSWTGQKVINEIGTGSLQALSSTLDVLRFIDPMVNTSWWNTGKTYIQLFSNILKISNTLLDKLTVTNSTLMLTNLFPEPAKIRTLLETVVDPQAAAEILTASVFPMKLLELVGEGKLFGMACNKDTFRESFQFPADVNSTAVQITLCSATQANVSVFDQLLNMMDAKSIIQEAQRAQKTVLTGPKLWSYAKQQVQHFKENMKKIGNAMVNGTETADWAENVMTALSDAIVSNMKLFDNVCTAFEPLIDRSVYERNVAPILSVLMKSLLILEEEVKVTIGFEEAVCSMDKMRLPEIVKKLSDIHFFDLIKKAVTGWDTHHEFNCNSIVHIVRSLSTGQYSVDKVFSDKFNNTGVCIEKLFTSQVVKDLDSVFRLVEDVMKVLQDKDVVNLSSLLEPPLSGILPSIEIFLKAFLGQENLVSSLAGLLTNETAAKDYFVDILQYSPQIVENLFQSTLSLDIVKILNNSAEVVAEIFCDPDRLDGLLTLPPGLGITVANLSQALCTDNITNAVGYVQTALDLGQITLLLSQAGNPNFNATWLQGLATHISSLMGKVQSITDLSKYNLNDVNYQDLLPEIQKVLNKAGPLQIIDSLVLVINDFKGLDSSESATQIIDGLVILVKGLDGLRFIKRFVIPDFEDLLLNATAVRNYMKDDLGFSPEVTEAIMKAEPSLALQDFGKNVTAVVCTPYRLEDIIHLKPNQVSKVTIADISEALCKLDPDSLANFTSIVFKQLHLTDILNKFMDLTTESLLGSSGFSVDQVKQVFNELGDARDDLNEASRTLVNISNQFDMDSLLPTAEALTGDGMSVASEFLCGRKTNLGDEFSLGGIVDDEDKKHEFTAKELEEIEAMPTPFCQDTLRTMYSSVGSTAGILWAYLKPLLQGKILISPNTAETREIILKANSTFEYLYEINQLAHTWSARSLELKNFISAAAKYDSVVKLLSNAAISDIIKQMLGIPGKAISDILKQVKEIPAEQMDMLHLAASLLANYTDCLTFDRWQTFDTPEEVFDQSQKLIETRELMAAVEFVSIEKDPTRRRRDAHNSSVPKNVIYKIRMDIDNVPSTTFIKSHVYRPLPEDNFAEDLRYLRGFVQLQGMLDQAIIEIQTNSNDTFPNIYLQQFPFPCHQKDDFLHFLSFYLLPVMMTIAWIGSLGMAIKILMYDRERGLEETLQVMGLKAGINWIAWLIVTMIFMILVSGLEVLILKVSGIFRFSNWFIMILYLVDFCLSSLMLCYMVSAFFTRANMAALTCLIVYLISYLPFVLITSLEHQLTFTEKLLSCLSSTTAFGFASQYMSRYEEQLEGIQWHNMNQSPVENDRMTMSWACIMMVVDSAIYLMIGWYVRMIIPRKYGMRQPWYFLVSPSYWCGSKRGSSASKYKQRKGVTNAGFNEEDLIQMIDGKDQEVGISLVNLTKTFSGHNAVDHLSMDLFKGQITSLLGHNGAGKTTTINMLTGVVRPSHGVAMVNGLSIYDDLNEIRKDIAICPQHNVLFDFMTVSEHLEFYIGLKENFTGKGVKEEITRMLESVDMYEDRHVTVSQLSGGMKRRLCVALAFVGGAETVILDEPTSGVDPSARRGVWDVILRNRHNRTILLSTHHLDEADVLSDRISILHEGRLLCSGSSLFLKKHLGSGYHLQVAFDSDTSSQTGSASSSGSMTALNVLTFVQQFVPQAEIQEEAGNELKINLPANEEEKQGFYKMFLELDQRLDELGIASYGISDTTLEEVFLKVCYLADNRKPFTPENLKTWSHINHGSTISKSGSNKGSDHDVSNLMKSSGKSTPSSGCFMVMKQFGALLIKRFHHYRRDWRLLFSLILLPLIFVACGMGFSTISNQIIQTPPLVLTPAMYGHDQYAFLKEEDQTMMYNKAVSQMYSDPGLGTTCMADMRKWKFISDDFDCETDLKAGYFKGESQSGKAINCTCNEYRQVCEGKTPRPSHNLTRDGIKIQNLNSVQLEPYLLNTNSEFKMNRYGGWSLEADEKIRVWFNNKGHHALPAYMNSLSNTILRTRLPASEHPEQYGITAINHPYRLTSEPLGRDTIMQKAGETGVALVILMAFSFVTASVIIYVVDERIHKEKQLQYISGVSPLTYWIVAFIWDMLVYSITVGLAVLIMWAFRIHVPSYWKNDNLPAVVVLLLLFGTSCTCMMYMTNKLFSSSSTAYMTLFCLNLLVGVITSLTVFLLSFFQNYQVIAAVHKILKYVFMIFPQYCLGEGLIRVTKNQIIAEIFERFGESAYKSPFEMDFLGWLLVAMGIQTAVFFIITLLTEIRPRPIFRNKKPKESMFEDDDVKYERDRVENGQTDMDVVNTINLSKLYLRGLKKVVAVDGVSFGVHRGECFGLLGVNGAGKTTTFKMLTGTQSSGGAAFLNGQSVGSLDSASRRSMGYCPQVDALDDYLSGRELLYCHARLKGASSADMKQSVQALSSCLNMDFFIDDPTKTYSGGMKRKLSLAVAVLGDPDVIYLDEPTAGMDPGNKRLVWNLISDLVKGGKSVVLTSHSMAECDILCNRIAIMVNGKFVCMGSPQHLKNKFSEGYRVIMKLKPTANSHAVSQFIFNKFPGTQFKAGGCGELPDALRARGYQEAVVLSFFAASGIKAGFLHPLRWHAAIEDEHQGTLEFAIPLASANLANIFGHLEREKHVLDIQDYSVQQTTLDAVFIHFARTQTDGLTESPDGSVTDTDLAMSKGSVKSKMSLSGPFVNETYAFMRPNIHGDGSIELEESGFYSQNLQTKVSDDDSQITEKAKLNPLYGVPEDLCTHL